MITKELIKKLIVLKGKFAASSGVATLADMGLFALLSEITPIRPEVINVISSTVGMLINFVLQKKYVFELNRKVSNAFLISMGVSIGGIALSTGIIHLLTKIEFIQEIPIAAKIIATGIVFFYNFYLKRFAFEKKFL